MLGLTLAVFLLASLAPGGVAGGLSAQTAGEAGAAGAAGTARRAAEQAYLEQRYGLDRPLPVQYVRWLARLSPVKFGERDLLAPTGERFRWPDDAGDRGGAPAPIDVRDAAARAAEAALAVLTARIEHGEGSPQELAAREIERRAAAAYSASVRSSPWPRAGIGIVPGVWLDAPDLGWSFSRSRPASALIAEAAPVTLLVSGLAMALTYAVAVPTGVFLAVHRGTRRAAMVSAALAALWGVPVLCGAVLLVGVFASSRGLGWFPVGGLHSGGASAWTFLPGTDDAGRWAPGWLLDSARHLVLPVVCQSYIAWAVVARLVRTGVARNLDEAFVRTARAKGLTSGQIAWRHAFRAGLLPLIASLTGSISALLSGSVVVEKVFALPGMGGLLIDAAIFRDRELLMGLVLVSGAVTIVAVFIGDALSMLADPRVRRDD